MATLTQFTKDIASGVDEYHPPPTPPELEKPPNSYIQQLYVDLVTVVIEDLGEAMPHEEDSHPTVQGVKRGRIYIPSGLAANVLDLSRMLLERGFLPANTSASTLEYLSHKVFPRHFWYVRIKKWIPFARCDKCVTYFNEILSCKTAEGRLTHKASR